MAIGSDEICHMVKCVVCRVSCVVCRRNSRNRPERIQGFRETIGAWLLSHLHLLPQKLL